MPTDLGSEAERWNHHPGAVALNPLFAWPPRPLAVLRWYSAYWLAISTTTFTIVLAVLFYFWMLPDLAQMQSFAPGWMARVWLANLIPHCAVAGLLHMWLYYWCAQDKRFKYDARDPARDNGTFTFRNQVQDNMFWTIVSGITQWTIAQWLGAQHPLSR